MLLYRCCCEEHCECREGLNLRFAPPSNLLSLRKFPRGHAALPARAHGLHYRSGALEAALCRGKNTSVKEAASPSQLLPGCEPEGRSYPRKQNPSVRLSRSHGHQLLCCHSGFYSARCAVCANRILSAIPWVTVVLPSMTSTAGVECPHPLNFCGLFRYNFCFFCFMAQELQSPNVPVWLQHMNYSLF